MTRVIKENPQSLHTEHVTKVIQEATGSPLDVSLTVCVGDCLQ